MYRVAVNALQEFRAREEASPIAFDSAIVEKLSEHTRDESDSQDDLIDRQADERELAFQFVLGTTEGAQIMPPNAGDGGLARPSSPTVGGDQ